MIISEYFNLTLQVEVLFFILVEILNFMIGVCTNTIFNVLLQARQIWKIHFVTQLEYQLYDASIKYFLTILIAMEFIIKYIYFGCHILSIYPAMFKDLPNLLDPVICISRYYLIYFIIIELLVGLTFCFASEMNVFCAAFVLEKLFFLIYGTYKIRILGQYRHNLKQELYCTACGEADDGYLDYRNLENFTMCQTYLEDDSMEDMFLSSSLIANNLSTNSIVSSETLNDRVASSNKRSVTTQVIRRSSKTLKASDGEFVFVADFILKDINLPEDTRSHQ